MKPTVTGAEVPRANPTLGTLSAPRTRPRTGGPGRWWKMVPLTVILLAAVLGPSLGTFDPIRVVGPPSQAPNGEFWFGTDPSGMDIYSRVLDAARTNLVIATMAVVLTCSSALLIGLLTGMNESRSGLRAYFARGVSRTLDLFDSVPAIIVAMVLVALYGVSPTTLVVSISIIMVPGQARLVRTEVLRIRSEAYLDAARMAGASEFSVIVREVLPNSSWPVIENASYVFGVAVILTAALGFLGVGLPPPTAEWGSMISRGASDAAVGRWWSALFPALALSFAVAAVSVTLSLVRTRRA
jgi:peptide/nickel transport system permease protein